MVTALEAGLGYILIELTCSFIPTGELNTALTVMSASTVKEYSASVQTVSPFIIQPPKV